MPTSLYLSHVDHDHAPPSPFWRNEAIEIASTTVTVGDEPTITVSVKNIANTTAVNTTCELFWSDPTTGFMATNAIDSLKSGNVGPRSAITMIDGEWRPTFDWTVGQDSRDTNGGHVCLLARISCSAFEENYDEMSPQTDSLSAIRNLHVNMARAAAAAERDETSRERFFGFSATNTFSQGMGTQITAKPLDPNKDQDRLREIANAVPELRRELLCGRRFAVPDAVRMHLGIERLIPHPAQLFGTHEAGVKCAPGRPGPRLSRTGPIDMRLALQLVADKSKTDACKVDLLPYEHRLAMVSVNPGGKPGDFSVVDISHWTTEKTPRPIGGLTVIQQNAWDYQF